MLMLKEELEEKIGQYVYSGEIYLKQYLKTLVLQHNFYFHFFVIVVSSKTSLKM